MSRSGNLGEGAGEVRNKAGNSDLWHDEGILPLRLSGGCVCVSGVRPPKGPGPPRPSLLILEVLSACTPAALSCSACTSFSACAFKSAAFLLWQGGPAHPARGPGGTG